MSRILIARLAVLAGSIGAVILLWPSPATAQLRTPPPRGGEDPARQTTDGTPSKSRGTQSFTPLTGKQKFGHYAKSLIAPWGVLAAASGAGIGQARDDVPEWDQGMSGYRRRLTSSLGKHLVGESISFAVGDILGYDPRYHASDRTGVWHRTLDALVQSLRSKDDYGRWRIAYPHLAATFGAGLVSRTWYPESRRTISGGLESGAISLALSAAVNVAKEFRKRGR